jgi:hypothetical protein
MKVITEVQKRLDKVEESYEGYYQEMSARLTALERRRSPDPAVKEEEFCFTARREQFDLEDYLLEEDVQDDEYEEFVADRSISEEDFEVVQVLEEFAEVEESASILQPAVKVQSGNVWEAWSDIFSVPLCDCQCHVPYHVDTKSERVFNEFRDRKHHSTVIDMLCQIGCVSTKGNLRQVECTQLQLSSHEGG